MGTESEQPQSGAREPWTECRTVLDHIMKDDDVCSQEPLADAVINHIASRRSSWSLHLTARNRLVELLSLSSWYSQLQPHLLFPFS